MVAPFYNTRRWQRRPSGVLTPRGRRFEFTYSLDAAGAPANLVYDTKPSYFVNSAGDMVLATATKSKFDHEAAAPHVARGIQIENSSRTNACLRSSTFSDAVWVKTRLTADAAPETDPAGGTDAWHLTEDTSVNLTHRATQTIAFGLNKKYIYSVWAKADERDHLRLTLTSASAFPDNAFVTFDLTDGSVFEQNGTLGGFGAIEHKNGWWRLWIGATSNAAANSDAQLVLHNGTTNSYTGDGSSGVLVWGAQVQEISTFDDGPSSHIPTDGSAASKAAEKLIFQNLNNNGNYRLTVMEENGGTEIRNVTASGTNLDVIPSADSKRIKRIFLRAR